MKNLFLFNSVFFISPHVSTAKHTTNIERKNSGKKNFLAQWQVLLKVVHSQRNCVMLWISVNIPLRKLNNPTRKNFIKKYSGKRIPDESTLKKIRKRYLWRLFSYDSWRYKTWPHMGCNWWNYRHLRTLPWQRDYRTSIWRQT